MRLKLLSFVVVFLIASVCLATMTIYFKDGSSRQVHKITFRGEEADLYYVDGTMVTVNVDKLDLLSSGIGVAKGTYGKTGVTNTQRPSVSVKTIQIADTERQARLQMEYEKSDETAVALNSIGPIRKGDTVKVVDQSSSTSLYDNDNDSYSYRTPKNPDHAFVVVYRNPDGTYGKRLFDAVTFNNNFRTNRPLKRPEPLSKGIDQPGPEVQIPNVPAPNPIRKPLKEKSESSPAKNTAKELPKPAPAPEPEKKPWLPIVIAGVLIGGLIVGFLVLKNREKPFVDHSKFARYEEDLREFEIGIWLKNGKTMDQLIEICLKKFYQESPSALNIAMKIWKGGQKGSVVPLILKQTGKNSALAEGIYEDLATTITLIRQLITEVSTRTGLSPVKAASPESRPSGNISAPGAAKIPVEATGKTSISANLSSNPAANTIRVNGLAQSASPAIADVAVRPDQAQKVVGGSHGTSSVAPMMAAVPKRLTTPRANSDLPDYATHVLNQLAFLSDPAEKV